MTTTVTITISNGAAEQTFTRRSPGTMYRVHGETARKEAARLLLAVFAEASALYRAEIAEDVAAVRALLDAFGTPASKSEEPAA